MSKYQPNNIPAPEERRELFLKRVRMVLLVLALTALLAVPLLTIDLISYWWLAVIYVICVVVLGCLSSESTRRALLCTREDEGIGLHFTFGSVVYPVERIDAYCRVLPGISLNPGDRNRATMIYLRGGIYLRIKGAEKIVALSPDDIRSGAFEYLQSNVGSISYREMFPVHVWRSRLWQLALVVVAACWIYACIYTFGAKK